MPSCCSPTQRSQPLLLPLSLGLVTASCSPACSVSGAQLFGLPLLLLLTSAAVICVGSRRWLRIISLDNNE